jgi:hypothetical protein
MSTMLWVTPNEKREFQGFSKRTEPEADRILVPKTLQFLEDVALSDTAFTQGAGFGA